VEQFTSGWKRNYYGKGDVIAYRLRRDGGTGAGHVFGANVMLLVYGEAFWPTYTTGDNTGLVATDSMKNFIQRETLAFDGNGLEAYAEFLATKFLATYPQVEGIKVTADEVPYDSLEGGVGFAPGGPERATASLERTRTALVDVTSGLRGFRLLRLTGSAFHGFVRDQYTTLPDMHDRPLHMWLDLTWRHVDPAAALAAPGLAPKVRGIIRDVFEGFESGSIQQVIYAMGTRVLRELPVVAEVNLEAQNRTWDTVTEQGSLGVFTDPRPPYGCLGLSLRR